MRPKRVVHLLVLLGLPACMPGVFTPRLSRAPLPPGLSVRQAAFGAAIIYFDDRNRGMFGRITVAFMGVDTADLPPGTPVPGSAGQSDSVLVESYDGRPFTLCPYWPTAPTRKCGTHIVVYPTSVRFSSDSLGVAIAYEIRGGDRGDNDACVPSQ